MAHITSIGTVDVRGIRPHEIADAVAGGPAALVPSATIPPIEVVTDAIAAASDDREIRPTTGTP